MLNRITIMGRITADLEMRHTNSGKEYTNFSVAVDQPPRENGVKHYGMSMTVNSAYFTGERKGDAEHGTE